jgi:photosystem II stability/assembly factor-like uncharacterized protein
MPRTLCPIVLVGLLLCACQEKPPSPPPPILPPLPAWVVLDTGPDTGSDSSLRGLAALDGTTAWVTGSGGAVLKTEDGGQSWMRLEVPDASGLEIRDVELFDTRTALLMTSGQPARIYRTDDGGATFTITHESPHEEAFFDAFAFWDDQRGLLFSDPVEGRFLVLQTEDGGRSWGEIDPTAFPAPVEGEAGFAASGSNVAVRSDDPGGLAWIGTGGATARVLRSTDSGQSWQEAAAPLNQGLNSTGIFSLAFRDAHHGVAAGGDYQAPETLEGTLAWTADGGATWTPAATPPPSGHRAAVIFLPHPTTPVWIAVGRGGSDLSRDDGRSWERFSKTGFYTLTVAPDGTVWAAGSEGRVARLEWPID